MAKKVEQAMQTTEEQLPSETEYLRYRKKMRAAKAEMDEAKGRMGSAKEQEIAEHNLHADADRIVGKYELKSPEQQASFWMHLDLYWAYSKLANADLFSKPKPAKAAGKRRGRPPGKKQQQPEAVEMPRLEVVA